MKEKEKLKAAFDQVRAEEELKERTKEYLSEKLKTNELTLIALRQPCLLAAANLAKMKKA